MSPLTKHGWELTHIGTLGAVITTLGLVTHLTGSPPAQIRFRADPPPIAEDIAPSPSIGTAHSVFSARPFKVPAAHKAARSELSNPREVVVGPSGINSRYTLLST